MKTDKQNEHAVYMEGITVLSGKSSDAADMVADTLLPDATRTSMMVSLKAAQENGKGGWWDAERCPIGLLHKKLRHAVEAGSMIDIINYAAMIDFREKASHKNED